MRRVLTSARATSLRAASTVPAGIITAWIARSPRLRRVPWGLVATLLYAATLVSPQFVKGFGCDDLLNSCTRGYALINGQSIAEYLALQVNGSICAGRLYPLAVAMTYGLHYLWSSAAVFHAYAFALTLCDVALFYGLLRGWRLSPPAATLGTLFLANSIQLRLFYDPILQFAGLIPFMVGATLVALVAFQRYLATDRARWQAIGVMAFAAALLTYEVAYMVAPVFLLMARTERGDWRRAISATQPYTMLCVALVAFTLGLRYITGWNAADPYTPRLDLPAILKATAMQASGAIPASYAVFSPHRVDNMCEWRLFTSWKNWAMFAAAGGLTWACVRQLAQARIESRPSADQSGPSLATLAIIGGVIWILPGFLIALSPKYQAVVAIGLGYLPVFLQYFGLATLSIAAALWARARLPQRWPALARGLVALNACVALVTFETNATVGRRTNRDPSLMAMGLVEEALDAGLCDVVPDGATIWSALPHPWMGGGADLAGGHYSKTLGRLVYGLIGEPSPGWLARRLRPGSIPPPTFVMTDLRPETDWGYAVLGFVEPADASASPADAPPAEPAWPTAEAAASPAATVAPSGAQAAPPGPTRNDYRFRRFRLYLSGSYATRARRTEQLAIVALGRSPQGQPMQSIRQWVDLGQLEVRARSRRGVILEGAFAEPAEMALTLVIGRAEVAARLNAEPAFTLR